MTDSQPKLTKIRRFTAGAMKLQGDGQLIYSILLDTEAAIYVMIEENISNSKNPGSHSQYAYSVAACLEGRIEPYDVVTGEMMITKDNNVGAFVKAVVNDLMKGSTAPHPE